MKQKTTDLPSAALQGVPDETRVAAGWVLASVALSYRDERPADMVDGLAFPMAIGAAASSLVGRPDLGGFPLIARVARQALAVDAAGMARGDLAVVLAETARGLGYSWDDEDPNAPAIPKFPIPGPRRDEETVRLPDPRSDWNDEGEDPNGPAIPRHDIPGPRRSDESGRAPLPRRESAVSRCAAAVRSVVRSA